MRQGIKGNQSRYITLAIALLIMVMLAVPMNAQEVDAVTTNLQNPRIAADGTVTWDCVYFGHYPQSLDGSGGFNNDPIKWRVLSVDGNEVLLLADQILEKGMMYNIARGGCLWEKSIIRSWLNGYEGNMNSAEEDFSNNGFINVAFNEQEKNAICEKIVINNIGENTKDKIFLLSSMEAERNSYGFLNNIQKTQTRMAEDTDYTVWKGEDTINTDSWWLRSYGNVEDVSGVKFVYGNGSIADSGTYVVSMDIGIRPALYLDLSKTDWSYAGTVQCYESGIEVSPHNLNTCLIEPIQSYYYTGKAYTPPIIIKDGRKVLQKGEDYTVSYANNINAGKGIVTIKGVGIYTGKIEKYFVIHKASQGITVKPYVKTYGNKPFSLGAKVNSGGKLTYKSSNTKVVTVSSIGEVTLKGPGKTTITITAAATNNYNEASKNITVTVKPKKVTGVKEKKGKNRMTISWKRDTKATGYQITYAQNKKFKKGKKNITISKNKTVKRTIKKLKARKTYYVKVRAYKKVGKIKIYGAYSGIKKVKVK